MKKRIVILGCTASGKSDLAEMLAVRIGEGAAGGEGGGPARVMAVDSMQVYRGMDIGTAKPDAATRGRIPYLMLDVADPWESYSAARFVDDATKYLNHQDTKAPRNAMILAAGTKGGEMKAECGMRNAEGGMRDGGVESEASKIENRKSKIENQLILVAGTILYLRAMVEGLFEGPGADEGVRAELQKRAGEIGTVGLHAELAAVDAAAAGRIHPNDLRRVVRALEVYRLTGVPISVLQTQWSEGRGGGGGGGMEAIYIGIRREKEALNRRINARVKGMLEAGLVGEVRRLADDPRGFSQEAASAVGYRQILDHFAGKCSLADAVEQIKIQTRHLAKMQRTWLKRWPGAAAVHWIDAGDADSGDAIADRAMAFLASRQE